MNIQTSNWKWQSFAQIAPTFVDCASDCDFATWTQQYGVSNPSESGDATEYDVTPLAPYADVLYTAGVIGVNSAQIPDKQHTLLPTLHTFTYDTDVYSSDATVTQALEFDISQWIDGVTGMTFGTQCNHLGDGKWDVWDNSVKHWKPTPAPCMLVTGWNHVTLQVQREANNDTLYQSITMNGTTYPLNIEYPPTTAPAGWWGINLNFQMDSNAKGDQVRAYLDNFSFTYE